MIITILKVIMNVCRPRSGNCRS